MALRIYSTANRPNPLGDYAPRVFGKLPPENWISLILSCLLKSYVFPLEIDYRLYLVTEKGSTAYALMISIASVSNGLRQDQLT